MRRSSSTLLTLLALLVLSTSAHAQTETAEPPQQGLIERTIGASRDITERALALVGIRYRRGGNEPESGFDCSGLVRFVFGSTLGLDLPRRAKDISRVGEPVDPAELRPGDLVFFNTLRRSFSHVGIYLGDFRFLHSPSAGKRVSVEDMRSRYWKTRFNGARRLTGEN